MFKKLFILALLLISTSFGATQGYVRDFKTNILIKSGYVTIVGSRDTILVINGSYYTQSSFSGTTLKMRCGAPGYASHDTTVPNNISNNIAFALHPLTTEIINKISIKKPSSPLKKYLINGILDKRSQNSN